MVSSQFELSPGGVSSLFNRDVWRGKMIVEKIEEVINDGWTI